MIYFAFRTTNMIIRLLQFYYMPFVSNRTRKKFR
jgi:hypothetical protein